MQAQLWPQGLKVSEINLFLESMRGGSKRLRPGLRTSLLIVLHGASHKA